MRIQTNPNISMTRQSSRLPWNSECSLPLLFLIIVLGLRALYTRHSMVDTDEPQHLHVMWGILQGDLPYRDRFDNHSPLFHVLFAPVAGLIGESPDIVFWMRCILSPVPLIGLWFFYCFGARIFGRPIALWSVVVTLSLASWSLNSIEVRPDTLWMAIWFGTLAWLVRSHQRREVSWQLFLCIGFLLGIALAFSIKTPLLIVSLCIGWSGTWLLSEQFRELFPPQRIASCLVAAAFGFLIVPAGLTAWFASQGALAAMIHCLIEVNSASAERSRALLFLAGFPLALWRSWVVARSNSVETAVFLTTATLLLIIVGFTPSLHGQTFLPIYPLLILYALAWTTAWLGNALPALRRAILPIAGSLVTIGLLTQFVRNFPPWQDWQEAHRSLLRDALRLTKPGDYLFDTKGETIFRRRPAYYVFVGATRRHFGSRKLEKWSIAGIASKGAMVATAEVDGFRKRAKEFLLKNFLPCGEGRLRVAGRRLQPEMQDGRLIENTTVAVPGDYVVLRDGAQIPFGLDGGQLLSSARYLYPGTHTIEVWPNHGIFTLVWSGAVTAGMLPVSM